MTIRDATDADLPGLLAVHNYAIRELDAIWIDTEETLEERTSWYRGRLDAGFPVLVAVDAAGQVTGYGSYGPYRPRPGYRLTVEHSVYLLPEAQGKGLGKAMLERLIGDARAKGYHAMIAGIEAKNTVSIGLHAKLGFKEVSRMPQVGQKKGRWLDLVQMQLLLDDRAAPPGGQ